MEYQEPLKACPRCGRPARTALRAVDGKPQIRCTSMTCQLSLTVENDSGVPVGLEDQITMLRRLWNEKVQPDMIRVETMH